ncbi:MAG: transglycosylase SLT domain-containing protein, partial [Candidatus Micrarchaeota archaeon]
ADVRQELAQGYEAMNARVKSAYDAEIEKCAKKYGVPADRLRAHICAESGFKPNEVSHTGASGLSQQQPCYAEDLVQHCICAKCADGGTSCNPVPLRRYGCLKQGVVPGSEDERRLFDPELNICQGAKELKQKFLRFGSWECAAFAYLAGGGSASKYHCQPPSEDMGLRYIRRITTYYNAFRAGQCDACGRATHC